MQSWDAASGRRKFSAARPLEAGGAFALSPDERTLAMADAKGHLRLLDASSGKEVRTLEGPAGRSEALTFTPDGRALLAWDADAAIHRWEVSTGRHEQLRCAEGLSQVFAVAFSADGQRVACAAAAANAPEVLLAVVDTATGRAVRRRDARLFRGANQAFAAAWSPDGRTVTWGMNDSTIMLAEEETGGVRQVLTGHRGRVTTLAFSADGRSLVSGADDTTAVAWDLAGPLDAPDPADASLRLGDADAERAYRALRRLTADPARAVPLLRERLGLSGTAPPATTLDRLVAALDAERFAEREKASAELDRMGEAALPGLRERAALGVGGGSPAYRQIAEEE